MTGDSDLLAGADPARRNPDPGGGQIGRFRLAGLAFDRLTEAQVIEHIIEALRLDRGGWVVNPNIDVCRLATRDPDVRGVISGASLVLADGMPVLWAARLRGDPLPERVAGGSLIFSLTAAAAEHGWSIYLLGGAPGIPERAAGELHGRYPGLTIAGTDAPPIGFDSADDGIEAVRGRLAAAAPDIVYVGLGCPKQERLIARLAPSFPATWFIACGAAIPQAAKALRRAPRWMQRAGLSWLFRLATEPRRLFKRYVIHDLPFAGMLLASCATERVLRFSRR
jgi:N-acetylglucosaminyldiphosphoundecaprenol N-acetyl-beta-D-mannosaminyltransferase